MSGLLGMGLVGWVVSLVLGFLVGGVFFLSIKVQVAYVLQKRSRLWLAPALLYARMAFVGAILVLAAVSVPREKVAGALLVGVFGALVARVLVSRMVRGGGVSGRHVDD